MLDLNTSVVAGTDVLMITIVYFLTAILTVTTIIFLCACLDKKEKVGNRKGIEDEARVEAHTAVAKDDASPAGQIMSESVVEEKTESPNHQTSFTIQSESEYDAIGNDGVLATVNASNNAGCTLESTENKSCQNVTSGPLLPPRNSGSHLTESTAEYSEVAIRKSVNLVQESLSNAIDDTYEDVDDVKNKAVENQSKWSSAIVPIDDVYEPVGEQKSPNASGLTSSVISPPSSTVYDSIVIDRIQSTTCSLFAHDYTSSLIDDHYEPVPGDKPVGSNVKLAAQPDGAVGTSGINAPNACTISSPNSLSSVQGVAVNPRPDSSHVYAKVNKKSKSSGSNAKSSSCVPEASMETPNVVVPATASSGRDRYATIADVLHETTQRTSSELDAARVSVDRSRFSENDTGYDSVDFDSNVASPLNEINPGYDSIDNGRERFSLKDDVYEEMDEVVLRMNGANELKVL